MPSLATITITHRCTSQSADSLSDRLLEGLHGCTGLQCTEFAVFAVQIGIDAPSCLIPLLTVQSRRRDRTAGAGFFKVACNAAKLSGISWCD